MASLTQTAKTSLKELLNKKLNRKKEAIESEYAADLRAIGSQAKLDAIESFDVTDLVARGSEIVAKRAALLEELLKIHEQQDVALNKPRDHYQYYHRSNHDSGTSSYLESLLPDRTSHHESLLLAETDFGRKLNRIEQARDEVDERIIEATVSDELKAIIASYNDEFGTE